MPATDPNQNPYQMPYLGSLPNREESIGSLQSMQKMLGTTAGQAQQEGLSAMGQGIDSMAPVLDYFKKLLSGDRGEVMGAIGPEVDTISKQFGQIRQMLSTEGRGGGKASAGNQFQFQEQSQVGSLINQSRRGAATGLQGAATALGGMGAAETGLGIQAGSDAAQSILAQTAEEDQKRFQEKQMKIKMWTDIGKALGSLLGAGMMGGFGGLFSGGSSAGAGSGGGDISWGG
jgi:hypothetical protein